MTRWADWLRRVPGLAPLVRGARRAVGRPLGAVRFPGSAAYWRQRYAEGGDSGAGSYGKFALFKAEVLNGLFDELALASAIEFGCGDGNQLRLLTVRDYLGVDISPEAVARCRAAFDGQPGRRFALLAPGSGDGTGSADTYRGERADCALSLDVIYHLVEDAAFDAHMRMLFAAATRCVVIYSSDRDADAADGPHVRHRRFTGWVAAQAPQWRLLRHVPNAYPFAGDWRTGSFADFHVYAPHGP